MGMFRDTDCQEIDLVKEMAEALGSAGLKLDEILEKADQARKEVHRLISSFQSDNGSANIDHSLVNHHISRYNTLVDQAENARRWLLIQREAIGFRTHREVNRHYPIPAKIKLFKS